MPHYHICLNGDDWKLLPMMPREWEWRRVWEHPEQVTPALWIPAVVPGSVQDDAEAAGLIPDWTRDFNSRACEWTSERDWVYVKEFATPQLAPDDVARLCFEGVDYACHVFLNGQHLGDHEGMFDTFEFDVTAALASNSSNRLVVVVEHAPREVGQIGRTSEVRLWKARFAYDWDWCTRLVPVGIWDSVSLRVSGPAWIRDVQVTTRLDGDLSAADVGVSVDIGARTTTPVRVQTTIGPEGESGQRLEASVLASGESTVCALRLRIENPRLWWPNGYGEQPLYQAAVTLLGDDGQPSDERRVTFGLRRIRALPNDGAPEGARPYVVEVNGRRVFLKGWNWAPISQLYGREMPERYARWLRLAAHAHCNLLRVWGGGLLERTVFYDLCDRLGIMVWQEFIQSSSGIDNRPSTDPQYLAYIRGQAEKMILRRRNHPSLIIWCGGNELMDDHWRPLDDTHPALAVLKDCVERLDPDRIYLPTSGSGPCANADLAKVGQMHDVHGPWQYQGTEAHYRLYNGIDPLLHSEFGVEGAASLAAMRRANTESLLWPPDETNPLWLHKGAWWVQGQTMRTIFGDIADLDTYVRASQFLQAEGLRYAIEANRRRKWHCAGTIPWQFNESWPNLSCTNVLDFFGQPRPAFWWCRLAYEPCHVSARYDKLGWQAGEAFYAEVWLNNSLQAIADCAVVWELWSLAGSMLAQGQQTCDIPPRSAVHVTTVRWSVQPPDGDVFILRLRAMTGNTVLSQNDYVFSTAPPPIFAPLLVAPKVSLELAREGGRLRLSNAGAAFALFVRLDATDDEWLEFSANHLLLAPGETAVITYRPEDRPVRVSGLNSGEKTV